MSAVYRIPAMGKKIVRFECRHCGHCCTDVVCLPTPWDVIQIAKHTGLDPLDFLEFLSPKDISEVDDDDPTWLHVNGNRYIMALRRTETGCFFLDKRDRHCCIYESRPILCRLYPFRLHETREGNLLGFTLHKDVGCPRHRGGMFSTDPLYSLYKTDSEHQEDYGALVEVFNRNPHPDKRPEHFVDLFVEHVTVNTGT